MSAVKKFGTFAGVYTPSVLTILGVIMYLRLGWVVGEAGLIGSIVIILVAHVISITTGLSISSIATDKKIKTGGIYYILSRSLGLPMGGSIGITLFVGTALSIALYIVGFTENFLGIDAISNFLGMTPDINSTRIIGSIVLLVLFIIAFISTSLAIKSQFFVLGAIALSLISITLGFMFNDASVFPDVSTITTQGNVPIMTIFAIFFPAVTGFTAGVAMSGDLKDPKTSIPKGTMYAIATGLVVYLGLAIAFALFVDKNVLINDSNFLIEIAIYAPLVIAGIWGATLSSALGGILGAPRILQAVANDKIIPKFLGKGYGDSNEPRNALIFTFFIAEAGVLIGELDAIAEVVSMFYIAAYGFINLAFSLERWASTDFRPSFSINKWIGIIGFIASFGVMLELNPVAMVAAFIIMWLIYFLLKRNELKSDFGDVWGSVWSSMVRTSITKLTTKSLEKRNWKPNILLFSGKLDDRPHLLELAKRFVGKYGFLSHFDLQVTHDDDFIYTKNGQVLESEEQSKGIFYRRKTVKDIYEGIVDISSTYGFAGVEPNTVLLGWARNTKNPKQFVRMLKKLYKLDLNVVMMDYDSEVGFGNNKQIDVWWRGKGKNGNLSLQLVKFLRESDDWAKATLRLLIVNNHNDEYEEIYRQASFILENLRIDGDIRIINNQIEKKSFYDIVQEESVNSSLIFMGLPEIDDAMQDEFIDKTNELCQKIGTVVLVKASSSFVDLSIGEKDPHKNKYSNNLSDWALPKDIEVDVDNIKYPKYPNLAAANRKVLDSIYEFQTAANVKYLKPIADSETVVVDEFVNVINVFAKSINLVFSSSSKERLALKVSSIHAKALMDIKKKINGLLEQYIDKQQDLLLKFIDNENEEIKNLYSNLLEKIIVNYSIEDISPNPNDILDVKWFKFIRRLLSKIGINNFSYKINYKQLLVQKLLPVHHQIYYKFLHDFGFIRSQNIYDIEKFVNSLDYELQLIYQLSLTYTGDDEYKINEALDRIDSLIADLKQDITERSLSLVNIRYKYLLELIRSLNVNSEMIDVNSILDDEFNAKKVINSFGKDFVDIPEKWNRNQKMLLNHLLISNNLLIYTTHLRQVSNVITNRLQGFLIKDIIDTEGKYLEYLNKYLMRLRKSPNTLLDFNIDNTLMLDKITADNMVGLLKRNHKRLLKLLPKEFVIFNEESINRIGTEAQYGNLETVNVSVVRLLDYIVQDEFINIIQEILSELSDAVLDKNQELVDRIRVLKFQINNSDGKLDSLIKLVEEEIRFFEIRNSKNKDFVLGVIRKIDERRRVIGEKLSVYPFLKSAMNLKQYIRRREVGKRVGQFAKLKNTIYNFYSSQAAKLWYKQSASLIRTQSFMNDEKDSLSINMKQAKAISNISTNKQVLQELPMYYKQLFVDNQTYVSDLWVERKSEEMEVKRFLKDYSLGKAKAMLIRGESGSGKSFLSYKLLSQLDSESKIYTITPPSEGSLSVDMFIRNLKEILDIYDVNPIAQLPHNSCLVFEDVELWWAKSYDGFVVIDYIFELILKYSNKIRIVVIINSYAFNFISKLRNVADYFTHDALMSPIDAYSLQQMIWKRHIMGGLNLSLDNKEQQNLHSWNFAQLFNRFFRISKGVPATAIWYWLNNINEVKGREIKMSFPKVPDLHVCEDLSLENLWVLQLMVFHTSLTSAKLSKITNWNTNVAIKKLFELSQIGFIVEVAPNVYKMNRLLSSFIESLLKSKKYL